MILYIKVFILIFLFIFQIIKCQIVYLKAGFEIYQNIYEYSLKPKLTFFPINIPQSMSQ